MAEPGREGSIRRVPDGVLWLGLGLAVVVLLAVLVVALLSHLNPSAPPLDLPTASSR